MGSWLVDELINRGHKVVSVDDLSGGFMRNVNKKSKFFKIDLRNTKRVFKATKNIDIIFHLAAYAAEGQSIFSPIETNDINIKPMNNLLVAAVNNNVKKFVFTSSMGVYGEQKSPFDEKMSRQPVDPYGVGKAYCEKMLEIFSEMYGFNYTIIRPHNVYGPRQNLSDPYRNVLAIWVNRIMRGRRPLIYGDGRQTRSFSYIEDVTSPLANAGFSRKSNNQIINLGSDEVVTINKACRTVLNVMNSKLKPKYMEPRPKEVKHAHCAVKRSQKILGYRTKHTLKEGIEKLVKWAREVGPQKPAYRLPLEITKKAPKFWTEKLV